MARRGVPRALLCTGTLRFGAALLWRLISFNFEWEAKQEPPGKLPPELPPGAGDP